MVNEIPFFPVSGSVQSCLVVVDIFKRKYRDIEKDPQNIMRLFVLYCDEIAGKPYYDARNEASGELAKKVVALNVCLPFI